MPNYSPFSAKRYEHAGNHVYYIPPEAFGLLESPKPTYLIGTRGTGKTTLLKALSWDERLYNSWLREHVNADAFEGRYIGLYFKLPNVQLGLLDRWLSREDDPDYAAVFSFYLDLCWLETARSAIRHLTAQQTLPLSREAEQQFCASFTDLWLEYPACERLFGRPGSTLDAILALMHPMRRSLESFARRRTALHDVLEALPIGQIGSFGRRVGIMLASAFDHHMQFNSATSAGLQGWSFRICMDEGEVLTARQQIAINTMVRLTEWPVFYLVAYVSRPHDVSSTVLPNQTLQHADRQILVRDDMSDKEFKQLVEGVVNARISSALPGQRMLSTSRVLGKLDINELLEIILRESESEYSRALLESARSDIGANSSPPIYETYLRAVRPELSNDVPTTRLARRRQSSASIRKQMVAAYLSICRESRSDPMYASADMVLQISDKCIRDFLWQMESIFTASTLDLAQFLRSSVPPRLQNEGLHAAASYKMTLFRERVRSAPAEANRLVHGLARITAIVQSTGRNYEQIRTPERGIFTYRSDQLLSEVAVSNMALIREAAEAGFLRLIDDSAESEIRFRVHASLAPQYDFSYRGAYYAAGELFDSDVLALRSATTSRQTDHAIEAVTTRFTGRRARGTTGNRGVQTSLSYTENGAE